MIYTIVHVKRLQWPYYAALTRDFISLECLLCGMVYHLHPSTEHWWFGHNYDCIKFSQSLQ